MVRESIMNNEDFIHYHHIGGRGGSSELNRIHNKFHKDFNLYLYDTDNNSLSDFLSHILTKI